MPKVHAAGETSPGRGGRTRRVSTTLAEINVVPLVDVMLVLLIIFMVTAPMIHRGIDVNLPVARRAQPITGERIEVTVPITFRTDGKVFVGDRSVNTTVMKELVRQKMEATAQKDVYLRGDSGVQLGDLVTVTDLLKDVGVEHVGLVTKMPGDR
jgi:biopolymer transport protein TolR